MDEHVIRLRAGWEWAYGGTPPAGPDSSRRIDLPVPWPDDWDRPVRLTRRFGRPARAVITEGPVRLKLATVPGLVRVSLNREALPITSITDPSWTVTGLLRPRNVLLLEADPPPLRPEAPWGEVWLAFADETEPRRSEGLAREVPTQ